jgi:hypothetical protein
MLDMTNKSARFAQQPGLDETEAVSLDFVQRQRPLAARSRVYAHTMCAAICGTFSPSDLDGQALPTTAAAARCRRSALSR